MQRARRLRCLRAVRQFGQDAKSRGSSQIRRKGTRQANKEKTGTAFGKCKSFLRNVVLTKPKHPFRQEVASLFDTHFSKSPGVLRKRRGLFDLANFRKHGPEKSDGYQRKRCQMTLRKRHASEEKSCHGLCCVARKVLLNWPTSIAAAGAELWELWEQFSGFLLISIIAHWWPVWQENVAQFFL